MNEKLLTKNPIYPLIGLLSTVIIIIFGVITAKNSECIFFLGAMWLLFLFFGYWRACIAVIPVSAVLCAIFAAITYAISGDIQATYASVNRILAVCIAIIPGLALSPIILVRNFSSLKMPRMLTLGMMITLNFFPLLTGEVRQVREAMKTRGAGSFLSPKIFYRAFLIPLIIRLVNISDTLALSVETRGFSKNADDCSVYKTVKLKFSDVLFLLLVLTGAVLAVIL
jgi:energy-coupling factor transport system permease protein